MIRSTLRRVVRRLLGRTPTPPRPPRRTAPPAAARDEHDGHDHDHGHSHDHGHAHDHGEEPDLEVDGETLAGWLANDAPVLLDVREPNELLAGHAEGAVLVPMNQVPHRLSEIPKGRVVVYCAAGARSYGVAGFLREHGWPEAYSLAGGFGDYVAHGGAWLRPPFKAAFPLASRVRITRDPLEIEGVVVPPDHRAGTVQEVRETDTGVRYAVGLVDEGGAPFVIRDLAEGELARG